MTPPTPGTVQQWLTHWTGLGLPVTEARMLLQHSTGLSKTQLITQNHLTLNATEWAQASARAHARLQGQPMAYLLGQQEFFGRTFKVGPSVLIPRPETEELVEQVLRADLPEQAHVLDVGTGSGCIACTLALERPSWSVSACDVSADALATAQLNAQSLNARVHFFLSDYLGECAADERFDAIVSNPPYIAQGDAHLSQGDLRFEPACALTDQHDGLNAYRALSAQALRHLKPGGLIAMEHGFDQQVEVLKMFSAPGWARATGFTDLSGNPRMVLARRSLY